MYRQTLKMPKGIFKRKPVSDSHRKHLSLALRGNQNGKGKNLGNKNAFGKVKGDKNGNWKGGKKTLAYKEQVAGRKRPQFCEICGAMGKISFDHDHQTGKFRGWICRRCNLVLGMVKDNGELLISLSKYLDVIRINNGDQKAPGTN